MSSYTPHSLPLTPSYLVVRLTQKLGDRTQVINTVRACFAALRQIRNVRRSLPQHALLTLIRTLVITKCDQCNSVLVGVYLQDQLVRAECRRSACLMSILAPDVRTHNPTATGASLVARPGRIQFRLCVLAYHYVHGTSPAYLSDRCAGAAPCNNTQLELDSFRDAQPVKFP